MKKGFRLFVILIFVVLFATIFVACGETDDSGNDVPQSYTVTFHLGEGLDNVVWNVADDIPILKKEGYHIVGYYLDENLSQLTTEEEIRKQVATQNIDVYIGWEKDSCNHNKIVDNPVLPTCTESGLTQGSHCDICGEVVEQQQVIPALGHDEVHHDAKAPTCTDIGWDAYVTCSRCEYTTYGEKAATGHTEVIDAAVAPTCNEKGKTEGKHCSVCKEVIVAQTEVSALGHDYSEEWIQDIAPNCISKGSKSHHCSRCGDKADVAEIAALGHTEVADNAVEPTCTTTGLTCGTYCSTCGTVIVAQTEVPALGHKKSDWIVDQSSTCSAQGEKHVECIVCKAILETSRIDKLSHTEVVDKAVESTCTESGLTQGKHCSVCDYVIVAQTEVPALGHDYSEEWVQDIAPTCTEKGSKAHHCSRCSDKADVTEVAALGHTEVVDKAVEPTCTTTGLTCGTYCSTCGTVIVAQTEVPALGHDYSEEWVQDIAPTCTEKGSKAHHCSRCSDKADVTEVAALGHTEVVDEAISATCTTTGLTQGKHCSVCNIVIIAQTEVPALGHTEAVDKAVEPTCTESGLTEGTHCSVCNAIIVEQTVVSALGHKYENKLSDEPETYEYSATCYRCGHDAALDLDYVLSEDGQYYIVNGFGKCASPIVRIPDTYEGIKVCKIADNAFVGIPILTVEISDSVTQIGNGAFLGCRDMTDVIIGNSVSIIGNNAFMDCAQLACITIPESVTQIGDMAFRGCKCLKDITIPNSVTSVGMGAFAECCGLANVLIGSGVRRIETRTFNMCSLLANVVVPSSVEVVWDSAFEDCVGLKQITIEFGVRTIGSRAFSGCSGLTSLTIPNSVTSIGSNVISGCSNLHTLAIPFVGDCRGVTNSDTYQYPLGYLFGTEIYDNSYAALQNYYLSNITDLYSTTYYIPESLKVVAVTGGSILAGAFENCKSLTEVYFADMLVPEQYYTDENNRNLIRISEKLGITFESIAYVAENSLAGCSSVEILGLPFLGKQLNETDTYSTSYCDKALRYHPFGFAFGVTEFENTQATNYYSYFRSSTASISTWHLKTYYIPIGLSIVGVASGCVYSGSMTINENMTVSLCLGTNVDTFYKYAFWSVQYMIAPIRSANSWFLILESDATLQKIPVGYQDYDKYYSPFYCNAVLFNEIFGSDLTITKSEYEKYPENTFRGQSQITSITAPSSVAAAIAQVCDSKNLVVTITGDEENIAQEAFKGCDGIIEVYIQEGVKYIYSGAFNDCSSLVYIEIPSTMSKIGTIGSTFGNYNAFSNCKNLFVVCNKSSLSISGGSSTNGYIAYYAKQVVCDKSENKVSKDPNGFIIYTEGNYKELLGYVGDKTDIVIPDGIMSIYKSAFENRTDLTSITIPNSVMTIGENAFLNCSELITMSLGGGVTSIGGSAFSGCSKLARINIPESVTRIGNSAFLNCTALATVDWNARSCDYAGSYGSLSKDLTIFKGCSNLSTVNIGENVKNIPSYAFYGCTSIKNIYYVGNVAGWCGISGLGNLMSSSRTLYIGGEKVEGDLVISDSVKSIGDSAFKGCSGLTSVTIPNSVTSIGGSAFNWCSELTSIYYTGDIASWCGIRGLGNLMSSSRMLYIGGEKVEGELIIPDSVKSIGDSAFKGCSGLTSITIPNSVTSIGNSAFSGCSGLTSLTIPDSVTDIGDYAFSGCSGLTSVTIPNSVTSIGNSAFSGCGGLTSITIPDSVTSIGEYAFNSCSGLTNVTIDSGVTSIGNYAFKDCCELTMVNWNATACASTGSSSSPIFSGCSTLATVIIGNNVTTIPSYAFYGCSGLTNITIGNSVTSIGNYAFYGCSGLTSITIPNSVTSIGHYAFYGCSGLTSLTIPDSVTDIGDYAFSGCSKLNEVAIGSGASNISSTGFDGCSGLTSISVCAENEKYHSPNNCLIETTTKTLVLGCQTSVIPSDDSVTSIGYEAFRGCTGLTSIVIPDSVTSIGGYAFNGCVGLTSITIPNSVTSIGRYAFKDCSGLTTVNWNATACTSAGSSGSPIFSGCSALATVIIGNDVTVIPSYAFSGCSGLTCITIPDNVTSIGYSAFNGCNGLKNVYYFGTSEQWGAISIGDDNSALTSAAIYYYCEGEPALNADSTAYDGNYWHYDVDGNVVIWKKES